MVDIERGEDDEGRRWYTDGHNRYMSVTTVLDYLDEDTTGLEYWRRNNQGEGDDFHWEHIFWMSGPRGTLVHWRCLDPLSDRDLWGDEERAALKAISRGPADSEFDDASHGMGDITYSTLKNREHGVSTRDQWSEMDVDLSQVVQHDVDWCADQFEDLKPLVGINEDSVIAVEQYLLDDKYGYGGQCDLVYEDLSGNVVLADIKTSSSLRQDHRLQAVAYAVAVENSDDVPVDEVDRLEVIRLDPDKQVVEVYSHIRPDHIDEDAEWYNTDEWFEDPWGDFEYASLDEMWKTFEECVESAHSDAQED